ncbi:MAG: four helix bundle protein [Candidatus Sungbacteria bacterium]|nr:four helix bundle protein [Candidatus Sungbacteria bacterium]
MTNFRKKFRFRGFQVYEDARKLSRELKNFSQKKFPAKEKFALLPQLWRSPDSIVLNIAEGSDRGTDKDFALFLNRFRTSLNEVVSCLDIALDNMYIGSEEHREYLTKAAALADQLTVFRRKLLLESNKGQMLIVKGQMHV